MNYVCNLCSCTVASAEHSLFYGFNFCRYNIVNSKSLTLLGKTYAVPHALNGTLPMRGYLIELDQSQSISPDRNSNDTPRFTTYLSYTIGPSDRDLSNSLWFHLRRLNPILVYIYSRSLPRRPSVYDRESPPTCVHQRRFITHGNMV